MIGYTHTESTSLAWKLSRCTLTIRGMPASVAVFKNCGLEVLCGAGDRISWYF